MPGKKLITLAAASAMGLSLAAATTEAQAGGWHSGWTGFGVGLLAAPLIFTLTRPILGGVYDVVYAPFGGPGYVGGGAYGGGVRWSSGPGYSGYGQNGYWVYCPDGRAKTHPGKPYSDCVRR